MTASLKTALFFILATIALAATHNDVALLKKSGRHPFWAGFTNFGLSVEEASQERARMIRSALALPSVHTTGKDADLWLDILTGKTPYPFEEGEKGLTPEIVQQKIIDLVDPLIGNKSPSFETEKQTLITQAERLVKMQLLNAAFDLAEKDSKLELKLKKEMITEAINHMNKKVGSISVSEDSTVMEVVNELTEALSALKEKINDHYFPEAILLLALLRNKVAYLADEIEALLSLAYNNFHVHDKQVEVEDQDFLFKYNAAIHFFGSFTKALDKSDQFVLVFKKNIQTTYAAASKSGSSIGSPRFRGLIPHMAGQYIAAITEYVDPTTSYQLARTYLRQITTSNAEKASVISLLRDFVLAGKLPQPIIGGDDRTFTVQAMKIIDLVKRIPVIPDNIEEEKKKGEENFQDCQKARAKLLDWWMSISNSFDIVLAEVNAETIDRIEVTKIVVNDRFGPYNEYAPYYDALYTWFINLAIDGEVPHNDKLNYALNVLDHVQKVFTGILANSVPETDETKFIAKYYVFLIFHLLRFRPDDNGTVHFQNFIEGNLDGLHTEMASLVTKNGMSLNFNKFGMDFNKEVAKKPEEKITKVMNDNRTFFRKLIGKDVPYKLFKKDEIGNALLTEETVSTGGQADKKVATNFGVTDADVRKIDKKVVPKVEVPTFIPTIKLPEEIGSPKIDEKTPEHKEEKPVTFLLEPSNNDIPVVEKDLKKEEDEIIPEIKKTPSVIEEPRKDLDEEDIKEKELIEEKPEFPTVENKEEESNPHIEIVHPIDNENLDKEEKEPEEKEPVHINNPSNIDLERKPSQHDIDEEKEPNLPEPVSPKFNPTENPDEQEKDEKEVKTIDHGIEEITNNKIIPIPLDDIHDGPDMDGEQIPITPSNIEKRFSSPEEIKNLIEVMKGQFNDPEQIKQLEEAGDLIDVVMKLQVFEHPNGDRTEYYYLQLVEKGTGCHDAIID
jgi:hypothetical protein